jgi:hypothetical protein
MRVNSITLVSFFFAMALAGMGTLQFYGTEALAQSSYYTSQGCSGCHTTVSTCNGCHAHGTHPSSAKSSINVAGATNKTSYAPGETVTVTLTGGYRNGWFRAVLYNQSSVEVARSTGNDSGMGSSTTYPATLSAPAPTAPGTYSWKVGWYGNQFDSSGAAFGSGWTVDATNPNHGYETVSTNSFTVTAAPIPAPTVSSVTPGSLVQGAVNQTVTIAGTNLTGATVTFSNAGVTHGAATITATSISMPVSVTANAATGAGTVTVTTGTGSASSAFTVTASTVTDTTKPTLTVSALANGSFTNKLTLNVSGTATDAGGLKSVTVNGQAVQVNPDGTFSTAVTLTVGANTITVVATDNAGNQQTDTRTITYDLNAPVLTITGPADNSVSVQSFITVSGTVNETSTVSVTVNNGSPQLASITGNNFTATVNLVTGVNTIAITATDLAGNVTSAKRTVTYDGATFTLAVTYPNQDITTNRSYIILTGRVSGATSKVNVTVTMDGRTYNPLVDDGVFRQRLTFTRAKQYVITVKATDQAGNRNTVTRNVIYTRGNSRIERDD